MGEIIRQALDNCRSVYNLIHGPEFWLLIAKIAAVLGLFDGGALFGMWLYALLDANGRDDDE